MEYPLVTIISPSYNHSKYVIDSLNSIKNQDYPNIEHIIIDDASSDNSVEIIHNWISQNNYPCIFIQHKQNKGIAYTLNESIEIAKGKYWTGLSTDDIAVENRTSLMVEFLEKNTNFNTVYSDGSFIDDSGARIQYHQTNTFHEYHFKKRGFDIKKNYINFKELIEGNFLCGSIMIKTKTIKEIGGYMNNLSIEDWFINLKLAQFHSLPILSDPLLKYRYHADNSVVKMNTKLIVDALKVLQYFENYCYNNNIDEIKKAIKKYVYLHFYHQINKNEMTKYFHSSKYKSAFFIGMIHYYTEKISDKLKSIFKK
jgi:alpha-1,3-rhamnosyltransferase